MSAILLLKLLDMRRKLEGDLTLKRVNTGENKGVSAPEAYPPNATVEKICRICAKYTDERLIGIFSTSENHRKDMLSDILKFANVVITQDDLLPKNVCEACCCLLDNAILFRTTCEDSDKRLRKSFIRLKADSEETSCDDNGVEDYAAADLEDDPEDKPLRIAWEPMARAVVPPEKRSSPSTLVCDKCRLEFSTAVELRKHMSSQEHISKRWRCADCDKEFPRKSQYTSHIQVHNERKYLCEICGKKCLQQHELKRHLMSHNRVTPYHCLFCDYKTWDSCYLKLHQTIHTGEKKYSCPHCPKKFINNSNMKRHIEKHADPKPHHCDACEMRYTTKYALRDHKLRAHDKIWLFHCPECKVIKSCRKDLQLHMAKVHKDTYVPSHSITKGPMLIVRSDQSIDDGAAELYDNGKSVF